MSVAEVVNEPNISKANNLFKIEVAVREKTKVKMAVVGPSGSGKTLSSLYLAYGLAGDWSKVYLADTESKSAVFYAGSSVTGDWKHIDFPSTIRGGYHPENWMALIDTVERIPDAEVLILDSFSHEYIGENGLLDVADNSAIKGNTFTGWKVATPMQRQLLERIRKSRLHIIATMRAVTEYAIEKNDKGKVSPVKVGLKAQQRDGTDYEFDIVFNLNSDNVAQCDKDRSMLFTKRGGFRITPEIGRELYSWSMDGVGPEDKEYRFESEQNEKLKSICAELGVTELSEQREIGKKLKTMRVKMKDLRKVLSEMLGSSEAGKNESSTD